MGSIITLGTMQTAVELGLIYSLVALALFLSYSMLNVCDLSTDGCFTLGCAVGATVMLAGHPFLAIFAAMGAGAISGFITAQLQTRFGIESILAGIIVNTGLYTINIFAMGNRAQVSVNSVETVFTKMKALLDGTPLADYHKLIVGLLFVMAVAILLVLFLRTRLGLSVRATGDNVDMVRASSINPTRTITVGLCLANAITGMAGCLLTGLQKSCDINSNTGMVTIALASLIIGETLCRGKGGIGKRVVFVVIGSCLYRIIVGIAMRMNMPAVALKLVSAVIVAVAIAMPHMKQSVSNYRKNRAAMRITDEETEDVPC
ncbi:MAG: ABC transporter permease [Oscillospiraceae bacterium]|jgi:putative ABC transport system permease protein|nr:ABC transporter permease [Oscillospiraceae bacterium]